MKVARSHRRFSNFRCTTVTALTGVIFGTAPWCPAQDRVTPAPNVGVPRAPGNLLFSLPKQQATDPEEAIARGFESPIPEGPESSTDSTLSAQGSPKPRRVLRKDYKTWSIFLVTNQQWLLNETSNRLEGLYGNFNSFGNAIGPENLAVWFWSHPPEANHFNEAVDVERSVAFCRSLNLKPSEGPYVVIMREYPGRCIVSEPDSFPKSSADFLVIKLNGIDATKTATLLNGLVDQLVAADPSKLFSRADDYWANWRRAFQRLNTAVLDLSGRVTVAFGAGPVKTEFKLGP